MAQMGLISRQIKSHKYRRCKKFHKVYGNILDRQFAPTAPNQVWTGDVTYIRIKGGWCQVVKLIAKKLLQLKSDFAVAKRICDKKGVVVVCVGEAIITTYNKSSYLSY